MPHVQILNNKVVAVFGGPQSCEGYAEVADDDSRLVAFNAPKVPTSVTMRQARLALLGAGLLASVDAAIASLPSPQKEAAQIEWDYSSSVERNRPFVLTLGAAFGLSSAQLDALFIAAAAL